METIGEGTFAVVKRAFWKRSDNEKMECAAKILHNLSNETRNDIISEISNMQKLRHQNLVQLHGNSINNAILIGENNNFHLIIYCMWLNDLSRGRLCRTNLHDY